MVAMTKYLELKELNKREKIQRHFWNEVGAVEHISLPRLKNGVKKEFKCKDDRFLQAQIELMQTEARIRIESRVKSGLNHHKPTVKIGQTQDRK
jgi:hypothetical protein